MAYALRRWRDGDAEALSGIYRRAVESIGPRAYSPDQVAAWLSRSPDALRFRARVADGAMIFVAADSADVPVAYALLEPDGHLDHLYNHPDHTRRGLATQLLASAESHARELGIERLHTEASDLARPAFERAGYRATHRRDFAIDGVPIHNWAMEKALR